MNRVYLPTLAELIDRLCIVQLKAIFIGEHKSDYEKEIALIMQDIDTVLQEGNCHLRIGAEAIHAVSVLAFSNLYIWTNESRARQGGDESDKLLKLTHSINGVRNTAKNILSDISRERKDFKIDCFSESLVEDFGNWNVFKL